jgi:tetratricopeptide (TPR) repeat protein
MPSLVITWVLAACMALGPAPSGGALDPEARTLLDEGASAYARGDFTGAIAAFERGYAIDPAPVFLYAWAQAARYAGDCVTALDLYDRFLATDPPASQRSAAEGYRAKCAAVVPPSVPEPKPQIEPDAPMQSPITRPRDAVKRRIDPVGPALLGVGSSIAIAGAALLGVGLDAVARQNDTTAYQDFSDLDRRKRVFLGSGAPILAVGLALFIGGTIRLARARRAAARERRVAWTR